MKSKEIHTLLAAAKEDGWVLEPQAKEICRYAGLPVPPFFVAASVDECEAAAAKIGFPMAAKVVSPLIVHKTEYQGVAINIVDLDGMKDVYQRFSSLPGFRGALFEKMVSGVELIVGAKNDPQFGPVVLLGIGGIGVEIYKDTALRMAPLRVDDVEEMIAGLKGKALLEGHRGAPSIDRRALVETVRKFSELAMEISGFFESIDINPLFCSEEGCFVADARIILK